MDISTLNRRIGRFYDESTPLWLASWGEHMHHGYYGSDGRAKKSDRQAQVDMIEALLEWGKVGGAERVLDAGCGVGGSARYLARRFGAEVLGLTLSKVQLEHARRLTAAAGMSENVTFAARDLMTIGAPDGDFDLIWSLESAEHVGDKRQMLQRFYERLRPGGKLILVTWCHRSVPPALTASEKRLLGKVCNNYKLPPFTELASYEDMAEQTGFREVQTADWSASVAPFWKAVIRSAFKGRNLAALLRTGWSTIRGAWTMQHMQRGYRSGLIRFVLLQGTK